MMMPMLDTITNCSEK